MYLVHCACQCTLTSTSNKSTAKNELAQILLELPSSCQEILCSETNVDQKQCELGDIEIRNCECGGVNLVSLVC